MAAMGVLVAADKTALLRRATSVGEKSDLAQARDRFLAHKAQQQRQAKG